MNPRLVSDFRAGALKRLGNGLVTVRHAEELGPVKARTGRPAVADVFVESTREGTPPHRVSLDGGRFRCSCGPAGDCVHRYCARVVLGWWNA